MKFDWDANKAANNLQKHGVTFEEALSVMFDPFAITVDDIEHSKREIREQTIGLSSKFRILLVIHTERDGDMVRIISARRADREEAFAYEEEVKRNLSHGGR